MIELWSEKYRPKKIQDYVFKDANQKRQVESWVSEGTIPHLLSKTMMSWKSMPVEKIM